MKKRIAVILALALVCCLLVGVMPVSAATTVTNYYALANGGTAQLNLSAEKTAGKTIVVNEDYNHAVVQVLNDGEGRLTLVGVASGTTVVSVNVLSGSTVEKVYNCSVNVGYSYNNSTTDVSNATVALQIRKSSSYTDLYVGDTFNVYATVKDASGKDISGSVRYAWSITSGNAAVTSTYSSRSATVKVTSGDTTGRRVKGSVVIYGGNGSTKTANFDTAADPIYNSYGGAVAQQGGLYAYGGKVTYTLIDRATGNTMNPSTLGTVATMVDLPRSYRVPIGYQVGYSSYIYTDAAPSYMTFNSTLREYSVVVGIRKSTGGYTGGYTGVTGSTGSTVINDFLTLGNGYTIIAAIEAEAKVPVMKIGESVQITAAMLGGVPADASGMTYATGDKDIAVVDSKGVITALSAGATTLKVYYNNSQVIQKTIMVAAESVDTETKVEDEAEEGLVFNVTKVTRKLNTKVRFRIKTITLNGEEIDHKDLDWVSTKKSVCTVDSNGYIRTRGKGTCYIVGTTEDGEYTTKLKVTVK